MRARHLAGLSITLLTAGITLGAIGLHPAVTSWFPTRCGVVLCLTSVPAWYAATVRRAAERKLQRDTATYNRGYLDGLADVRRGLLDPQPPANPGHHEGGDRIVRHLRPIATYQAPERQAQ